MSTRLETAFATHASCHPGCGATPQSPRNNLPVNNVQIRSHICLVYAWSVSEHLPMDASTNAYQVVVVLVVWALTVLACVLHGQPHQQQTSPPTQARLGPPAFESGCHLAAPLGLYQPTAESSATEHSNVPRAPHHQKVTKIRPKRHSSSRLQD
jgi:hypothetical protein